MRRSGGEDRATSLEGAIQQALMALRPIGVDENGADRSNLEMAGMRIEVDTALEQLSPSASLIRDARLNW
jgi:hypothetical protein